MDLSKIPIGRNPPWDVNALIEVPQGGEPVKYELDKASGAIFVDRFLHTAMFDPGNYGCIPHTLAGDGDPGDVVVVGQTPVVPGADPLPAGGRAADGGQRRQRREDHRGPRRLAAPVLYRREELRRAAGDPDPAGRPFLQHYRTSSPEWVAPWAGATPEGGAGDRRGHRAGQEG